MGGRSHSPERRQQSGRRGGQQERPDPLGSLDPGRGGLRSKKDGEEGGLKAFLDKRPPRRAPHRQNVTFTKRNRLPQPTQESA